MSYHEETQDIFGELEHALNEISAKIMPGPVVTGEEKNWSCVPFEDFENYLPLIADLLDESLTFGKETANDCTELLWKWVDDSTYHMERPEVWIQKTSKYTHPPMWFFLSNIRFFSDMHALAYAKGSLNRNDENIKSTSSSIVIDALRWQRYETAQFALNEWRQATYQDKNWPKDYTKIVMGSILEGRDYTSVLPGDGLKSFLIRNQKDVLHCIHTNRYGMGLLPVAPVRLLQALKGGKLDEILHRYGEYTFLTERSPVKGLYVDLDNLGIEMTRDHLLSHMQYSSTGNQWLEAFRLLMARGELVDLHDACVPTINGSKAKPWAATSIPGPAIQINDFIKLLTDLCEKGESPRAAAIHYISELVQTDEQMPNRLIEAGLSREFLVIGIVREKNFMIDLGL